jgi:hypothetical protein
VEAHGVGDIGQVLRARVPDAISDAAAQGDGWLIKLTAPERRKDVLAALDAADVVPEVFSVKEPTLEEIFVDKVGGEEPGGNSADAGAGDEKKKRGFSLFGRKSKNGTKEGRVTS